MMKRRNYRITVSASITLLLFLMLSALGLSAQQSKPGSATPVTAVLPFDLPAPTSQTERNYLGLSEQERFTLLDIKGVILIEVLSVYCPYCQKVAPGVNDLYRQIENDRDLKGKIKLIGIGQSNSTYELDLFKEKYAVPFPLIPDPKGEVSRLLAAPGTPTFIGVKVDEGYPQQFYLKAGVFSDPAQFLADFAKAAGLK
jgi:peroxiredoxin